jgi:Fe-S cluster biosynthesis and repair protein YggX
MPFASGVEKVQKDFFQNLLIRGTVMARMVKCVLLGVEAAGLDYAPYPGELGQRIYENVSQEAWQRWLKHQTMLLNEYRLTPIEPKARKFLVEEMEKFFFGGGAQKPKEFVEPTTR